MEYVYKDKHQPTKAERAEKKEEARWDAEENIARKKVEDVFHSNYARLKSERLAREKKS